MEKVQPLLIQWEWVVWHWCNLAAKESGLECACVNNDYLTVLVSGGSRHVEWACVLCGRCIQNAWASKAMDLHHIALSLNILRWKLFGWFRRPQLWATGNWQLHHDNAHASCLVQRFLAKHQISQVTQPPYSPDLVSCDFLLFLKLKSPLKGKRFQTINEIQENMMGQLMMTERAVWVPSCLLWRGLRLHCPMYSVSGILYLLQ